MPSGLTIFNTSNTVQIDETWRNYGFRQIIPVNITTTNTNPPGNTVYNLSVTGQEVLVACKASTLCALPGRSYFDGTTWTFQWVFFTEFVGDTINETVEFYVFDMMNSAYSNVGLEIFNAAGQRVFHSDQSVMKVGTSGSLPITSTFTGVPGRSYVPLIERNGVHGMDMGFPVGFRLASYALRVSGSTIFPTLITTPNGSTGAYPTRGLYAAIDVTGLS